MNIGGTLHQFRKGLTMKPLGFFLGDADMILLIAMVKLLKPKVRIAQRRFKRIGIVFLFSCFLAIIFYFVFKSNLLVITKVNCSVKDKTSLADEKRWCEQAEKLLLGRKIFYSYSTTITSELEGKFLPVGGVTIARKLPQTVTVQIVERQPIARICPPGGLELLVDKEGVIYAETQAELHNLKTVSLELGFELMLGQEIGSDIVSLILLEEPQISFIKSTGQEGLEVVSNEQLKILLSRKRDLWQQIENLQKIIQKYKIEGKNLSHVDLRYDQPVIKY